MSGYGIISPAVDASETVAGKLRLATNAEAVDHTNSAAVAITPDDFWYSLMAGRVMFVSGSGWTSSSTGSGLGVTSNCRVECRTGTTAGSTSRATFTGSSGAQGIVLRNSAGTLSYWTWNWSFAFDMAFTAIALFSGSSTASIGRWTFGRDARITGATTVTALSSLLSTDRCIALECRYNALWLVSWNGTTYGQLNLGVTVNSQVPFSVRFRYDGSGNLRVSINGGAFSSPLATGLSGNSVGALQGFLVESRNETDTADFQSHLCGNIIIKAA